MKLPIFFRVRMYFRKLDKNGKHYDPTHSDANGLELNENNEWITEEEAIRYSRLGYMHRRHMPLVHDNKKVHRYKHYRYSLHAKGSEQIVFMPFIVRFVIIPVVVISFAGLSVKIIWELLF